jgi:hypothetical protein
VHDLEQQGSDAAPYQFVDSEEAVFLHAAMNLARRAAGAGFFANGPV